MNELEPLEKTHKTTKLENGEYCAIGRNTVLYCGMLYDKRQFPFKSFSLEGCQTSTASEPLDSANIGIKGV